MDPKIAKIGAFHKKISSNFILIFFLFYFLYQYSTLNLRAEFREYFIRYSQNVRVSNKKVSNKNTFHFSQFRLFNYQHTKRIQQQLFRLVVS